MSLSASFSLICWKIRASSRLSLSDRNKQQPQELIVASKQISRLHDKLILFRNLFGGLKRHTSLSDISKWQTKKKLFFFMCFFLFLPLLIFLRSWDDHHQWFFFDERARCWAVWIFFFFPLVGRVRLIVELIKARKKLKLFECCADFRVENK